MKRRLTNGTCRPDRSLGETTVSPLVSALIPVSVTGGKVYITGPYSRRARRLSVVDPVKAGPFDLQHRRLGPQPETPRKTATSCTPSSESTRCTLNADDHEQQGKRRLRDPTPDRRDPRAVRSGSTYHDEQERISKLNPTNCSKDGEWTGTDRKRRRSQLALCPCLSRRRTARC